MNMKRIFILLLLFGTHLAWAQKPDRLANGKPLEGEIFGQVVDSTSGEKLEFAAVSLYLKDKLVGGTITNERGKFSMEKLAVGTYKVSVQFVGYPVKTISNIRITEKNLVENLGLIQLSSNNILQEVVVDGSTPNVRYDIDRKVIDVSNLEVDLGQSAVEILENSPSVVVDNDGTVLLRGSSSFTLFIDGRPTAMEPSDALATIPASNIKEIEIITNPSAKYEAEGATGIMNIITKSNKLEGTSLLMNLTGGNYENYSGDVSVNVRSKKTEFNVGIDYRNRSRPNDVFSSRISRFDTSTTEVRNTGDGNWGGANYGANLEFTWFPNSAHTFSIGTRINKREHKRLSSTLIEEFEDDAEVFSYFNDGNGVYSNATTSAYFSYKHNFNHDKKHYLDVRGVYNYRYGDDVFNTDFLDADGVKTGGFRNIEKGPSNMVRLNVDYSKTFKKDFVLEAGTQIQFGQNSDDNSNLEYNPLTGGYELVPLYSNSATYVRNIAGAYVMMQNKWNDFGYQVGLRTEYTDREISSPNFDQSTLINRLDWFPTIHLSYNVNDANQFLLNYTRRIQRPRSYYLEPFITFSDQYSTRSGNPELNPEYIDAIELNWINSFENGFVSVETYLRHVNNYIDRIQIPTDTNNIHNMPFNVGQTNSIGIEPSLSYKLFDWWKLDVAVNIFYFEIISERTEINSSSNTTWNSRVTNTFPIRNSWNIQLASRYVGRTVTSQGEQEGYFSMNGSVRKSFSDNKFALIFQVRDIFSTIRRESFSFAGNVENYSLRQPRTPFFTLTFSMRLNNYRKKREQEELDDF